MQEQKVNNTKLFTKHILKNGLRLILAPNEQSLTATILVLVETGSKYESENNNGISHLLEHMCFKGTDFRPSALAISSELESLGASFNAFTGHERTGYYAKVNSEKIESAIEVISDIYLNSVFSSNDIEKEKGVIIEEINMYEDLLMSKAWDLFLGIAYPCQPAGRNILGTKDTVRSFNRESLLNYRSQHYVPQATVVVVAGAFDEEKILGKIKLLFDKAVEGEKSQKDPIIDPQQIPNMKLFYKESDQSHLVVGFRALNRFDKRIYALEILNEILGGGMSSRLFQRIREQLGAAYYIRGGVNLFTDHGLLTASSGTDNTRVKLVISAILDEFRKIKSQGISSQELDRAKSSLAGQMMIELETSDSIADFYARQELFKEEILTAKEVVTKFEAVSLKDVSDVANAVINESTLNLVLVGPFKDSREFESLLKF